MSSDETKKEQIRTPLSEPPTVVSDTSPDAAGSLEEGYIMQSGKTVAEFMNEKSIGDGISLGEDVAGESLNDAGYKERYAVGRILAEGGMGMVLNAKDQNCRRHVAMKVVQNGKNAADDQILRFIVEAQVTAQLEHPSIVPVYELSVDDRGNVFYTMKLVKGATLVDILDKIKAGDPAVIAKYSLYRLSNILLKVCDAVAFAHSKGVIHRDLKPENIMIGDFGEVLLMDWGLAKMLNKVSITSDLTEADGGATDEPEDESRMFEGIDSLVLDQQISDSIKTLDGQIKGTPGFMSPEQVAAKGGNIDERTDVYSLGAILYNILTLSVPISAGSIRQIIIKILRGDIVPPFDLNADYTFPHCPQGKIPSSLSAISMKAMSSSREERYKNVQEFQQDIEKFLGGYATSLEEPSWFQVLKLLIKRRKTEVSIIAVSLVILVTVVTGFMFKIVEAKNVAEANLEKFLTEQTARKEISRKLLATAIESLKSSNPGLQDLKYRYSITENEFSLKLSGNSKLLNISPLAELPLTSLDLGSTSVSDIRVLKKMPLKRLSLANTGVKNLRTLANSGITHLDISNTKVNSLQAIAELPLVSLRIAGIPVTDLSDLETVGLKRLTIDSDQTASFYALINLTLDHLSIINAKSSDVRILKKTGLMSLELHGRHLKNLDELKEMPLKMLSLVATDIQDLSPLSGMPLESLRIYKGKIKEINVISTLMLEELTLEKCYYIQDLTPIAECPTLERVLVPSHVRDIDFLRDHPNLKIIANNIDDYNRGQPASEFWQNRVQAPPVEN